ncbi:UMP-CMP kinase 2, mitochondrial [Plecturocebus cupreus]
MKSQLHREGISLSLCPSRACTPPPLHAPGRSRRGGSQTRVGATRHPQNAHGATLGPRARVLTRCAAHLGPRGRASAAGSLLFTAQISRRRGEAGRAPLPQGSCPAGVSFSRSASLSFSRLRPAPPRVSFPRRGRGRGRPPDAPMAFARQLLRGRLSGPRVGLRGVCAGAMAPPRRFVVELPDCSLAHFALRADAPGDADALDPRLAALLGPPERSYSLCVPVTPGAGCGARVRAARLHHRLLHQLRRGPFQRCQLLRLLCYGPGGQAGGAQHGFLLRDPQDDPDTRRALLELLGACQEAPRPHLGEFEADPPGRLWQRLWEMQDGRCLQVGRARVVPAPEPPLHPAVPDLASSVIFPDREVARAVLEEVRVLSLSSAQRGL